MKHDNINDKDFYNCHQDSVKVKESGVSHLMARDVQLLIININVIFMHPSISIETTISCKFNLLHLCGLYFQSQTLHLVLL